MVNLNNNKSSIEPIAKEHQSNVFHATTVLKRDVFLQTQVVYFTKDPQTRIVSRVVSASLWWSRLLAWDVRKT